MLAVNRQLIEVAVKRALLLSAAGLFVLLTWYVAGRYPALVVAALAAAVFILGRRSRHVLTLLGGGFACVGGVQAFLQLGTQTVHSPFIIIGVLAVGLGLLSTVAVLRDRPALAALLAVGGGVAMALFYINTYYFVAVPLLLAASLASTLERNGRAHGSTSEDVVSRTR